MKGSQETMLPQAQLLCWTLGLHMSDPGMADNMIACDNKQWLVMEGECDVGPI